MRKIFAIASATLLALAGCGASASDTEAAETGDAGKAQAPARDEQASDANGDEPSVSIPADFRGSWDMRASDSCTPGEPRYVVGENWTSAWDGERNRVVDVRIINANTVELLGEPDPNAPDADQRFGLALNGNGNGMTLLAPQMSSTNFVRCDGESATAARPGQAALNTIPARYRGTWGGEGDHMACARENSGQDMTITANRIVYYGSGRVEISSVRRVSANTIAVEGRYGENGKPTTEPVSHEIELSDDGERLSELFDGMEPFDYNRC